MFKPYQKAELSFQERQELSNQGQNSRTIIAHDNQIDAEIVIKQIPKNKLDATEYFNESRLLYASSHPNVVPLYYACEDASSVYIAMPYYPAGSLRVLMDSRHLTVRDIIRFSCQILSGLHNIHSKKLVHFDVKPDNVLLSTRSEALLSDFGLAKKMSSGGVAEQDRFYNRIRPPEGFSGTKFDYTADLYQFGVLLYRMCNGNEEFHRQFEAFLSGKLVNLQALRHAVINGQFPDRGVFQAHIPERMRSIAKRCMEPNPQDRFTSALEIANELARIDDEILDWQYSPIVDGRRWEKLVDGRRLEFEALDDGSTTCFKTVGSGKRSRVSAGTKSRMTERQIRSFLGGN